MSACRRGGGVQGRREGILGGRMATDRNELGLAREGEGSAHPTEKLRGAVSFSLEMNSSNQNQCVREALGEGGEQGVW